MALLPLLAACSENSDDAAYRSELPRYADITFRNLDTGGSDIHAGETFVAEAVETARGRLLDRTTLTWECEPGEWEHRYRAGVVYDTSREPLTDTLVAPQTPGRYKLTMTARYNVSGQAQNYNSTVSIDDGKISYTTLSQLLYGVTIEKYFLVKAAEGVGEDGDAVTND